MYKFCTLLSAAFVVVQYCRTKKKCRSRHFGTGRNITIPPHTVFVLKVRKTPRYFRGICDIMAPRTFGHCISLMQLLQFGYKYNQARLCCLYSFASAFPLSECLKFVWQDPGSPKRPQVHPVIISCPQIIERTRQVQFATTTAA